MARADLITEATSCQLILAGIQPTELYYSCPLKQRFGYTSLQCRRIVKAYAKRYYVAAWVIWSNSWMLQEAVLMYRYTEWRKSPDYVRRKRSLLRRRATSEKARLRKGGHVSRENTGRRLAASRHLSSGGQAVSHAFSPVFPDTQGLLAIV